MACRTKSNYYTNPAFSQQSEFINNQRALSPRRNARQSPVGAQAPLQISDPVKEQLKQDSDDYEEQQFYEEIFVDDDGVIKDKKFVVISQNNGKRYIQVPQVADEHKYDIPQELNEHKYEEVGNSDERYEYIPMREQETPKKYKERATSPPRRHHYPVVDAEEETELSMQNTRYALVPVEDIDNIQSTSPHRYEYIQDSPPKPRQTENYQKQSQNASNTSFSRKSYRAICQTQNRYEYIQATNQMSPTQSPHRGENIQRTIQQQRAAIATQKLHALLSTPRKPRTSTPLHSPSSIVLSPHTQRRKVSSPVQIVKDPFVVTKPSPPKASRAQRSKAHKKLNYAIGSQQAAQDKRHTAIVAPMCSSPIQSMYSDTTFSSKSASWLNLNVRRKPAQRIMTISAALLILCGGVNCGLGFYMTGIMGKHYYLDFGIISGFIAIVLGLSGLRSKGCYLIPGGNLSGYILLSLFSLSTCASLLILLFTQPKPGTPLADIMSGVVVGISLLSFIVAVYGIICSYCVRSPPRDNRVQHCSPGFSV